MAVIPFRSRHSLLHRGRPWLLLLTTVIATGCATGTHNAKDPWLAKDKALHLVAGMALGVTGAGIAQSHGASPCGANIAGVGLSFTVGLGKEWHDHRYQSGMASSRDLLATVVGGIIGAQLVDSCSP